MYDWHESKGRAYVTTGTGYGRTELSAFDAAELNANIVASNAIKATSFVPPHWLIIDNKDELARHTDNGVFLPIAYASVASNTHKVAASLCLGVNQDKSKASIITEYAGVDINKTQALEYSRKSVEDAFEARAWLTDDLINHTIEAVPMDGLYVAVLVAVVFIPG